MSKKKKSVLIIFLIVIAMLFTIVISFSFQNGVINRIDETVDDVEVENHIVIIGSYENEFFLKQVMEGAEGICDDYDAVVEFYVSQSQAEDVLLQSMFDYASFVNADGIIAYISTSSESVKDVYNIEDQEIPIVTTGAFAPQTQQISYIGTSYWELGQVFGEEIVNSLNKEGKAYIICSAPLSNPNFSNFTNSIQAMLLRHPGISFVIVDQLSEDFLKTIENETEENRIFACLTDEDTLTFSQYSTEYNLNHDGTLSIIGFGSNENCELYLQKGILSELISLDPKKIGENALREIFEYKNNGYANSYIAADIKIEKAR